MLKFALKEVSILFAFIVLGGVLLLSLWISHGIQEGVLSEYKDAKVSVIISAEKAREFRDFVEKDKNVIRYEFFSADANKSRLGDLYPELRSVIAPLETRFFPPSAIVTVRDSMAFGQSLDQLSGIAEHRIVHQPPHRLTQFLKALPVVFGILWLLTLILILYFNVERAATENEARWSLMKMLGARSSRLFVPLWLSQSGRIALASCCAVILAYVSTRQVQVLFAWNWTALPTGVWVGFFMASLIITAVISFLIFRHRYQKVALG